VTRTGQATPILGGVPPVVPSSPEYAPSVEPVFEPPEDLSFSPGEKLQTPAISAEPKLTGTGAKLGLEGIANGALTTASIVGAVAGAAAAVVEKLVIKPQQQEQKPGFVARVQKPPERKTAILEPMKPPAPPVAKAA